jgi:predicted dehydrogenase
MSSDFLEGSPAAFEMEYRYVPPVTRFIEQAQIITGGIRMLTIREHRYPLLDNVAYWNRFIRHSSGTFVEKCCRFFDLMRLSLKSEPVRIMASAGREVNHLDERYAGETPDIWDCGYVLVDFASAVARLSLQKNEWAFDGRDGFVAFCGESEWNTLKAAILFSTLFVEMGHFSTVKLDFSTDAAGAGPYAPLSRERRS